MKALIITCLTAFSFLFSPPNVQFATKTLIKTLRPADKHTLVLNTGTDVILEPWKGNTIRVFIRIKLPHNSQKVLNHLMLQQRYSLDIDDKSQDGVIELKMPAIAKKVMINQQIMPENIEMKVFAPSDIIIKGKDVEGEFSPKEYTTKGGNKH